MCGGFEPIVNDVTISELDGAHLRLSEIRFIRQFYLSISISLGKFVVASVSDKRDFGVMHGVKR